MNALWRGSAPSLPMLAAFSALSERPPQPDVDARLPRPDLRAYPLARALVPPEARVQRPRHIVVCRIAADGVAEIVGLAHDRMLLGPAAGSMLREADGQECPAFPSGEAP